MSGEKHLAMVCEEVPGGGRHCRLEDVTEEAAEHAVKKVFAILGVDVDKPESVEAFREDLRFGRRMRRIADHGTLVLIGAMAAGISYAAWAGILTMARNSTNH